MSYFYIIIMLTKPKIFSTAAVWIADSQLGIRSSVSLGIGFSKYYMHQSQHKNELKFIIQMVSPLLCRVQPLTSCEEEPQRRRWYCLTIPWDFSHRHDNSTQGSPYLALWRYHMYRHNHFYTLHLDITKYLKQLYYVFTSITLPMHIMKIPPPKYNDNQMSWPRIFQVHCPAFSRNSYFSPS